MIAEKSIVPDKYKGKDPRNLVYHFPSIPNVKMSKILSEYYYYRALECVEVAAHKSGFLLLPGTCMNWYRKRDFATDRKVKVLGKSFFMMKENELTSSEKVKLGEYYETVDVS